MPTSPDDKTHYINSGNPIPLYEPAGAGFVFVPVDNQEIQVMDFNGFGIEIRALDGADTRFFIQLVRYSDTYKKDMMAEVVLAMNEEGVIIDLWTEPCSLEYECVATANALWTELDDTEEK